LEIEHTTKQNEQEHNTLARNRASPGALGAREMKRRCATTAVLFIEWHALCLPIAAT
jgi:hypothetical protein